MSWIELEPILCMMGIYAMLALSLNVMVGMTGMLQLGHAGFYAIGAYASALYSIYFTVPEWGWINFVLATGAGVTLAMLFSLAIGFPCLRLRGDYLAIATLGFGEIVRLTLNATDFPPGKMFEAEYDRVGGPSALGFTEFPEDCFGEAWADYSAQYASLWVIGLSVLAVYILLRNIKLSRIGRASFCIREDEIAARAMGINISRCKLLAFALSAGIAGGAGSLYFHYQLAISPGDFSLMLSIEVLLMVVLGGMGSFSGAVLAAVLLRSLTPFLRHIDLSGLEWLPDPLQRPMSEYCQILYAVLLIALIRLAPNGLLGTHELPAWLGRKRRTRP